VRSAGVRLCRWSLSLFLLFLFAPSLTAQVIRLHVDLTDAPRNIYHANLHIPAHAGEMSLVFPKWIPGNHRPSGPLGGLTGIQMEAGGHSLSWQRDAVDMYEATSAFPRALTHLMCRWMRSPRRIVPAEAGPRLPAIFST
jgi:Peptidase M61 N-terminal domain